MEDTLNVVIGMHIVVAGECEERAVLEDQFANGIDIALIASQKYSATLGHNLGHDLFCIVTQSRTPVEPVNERLADTRTFEKKR